MEKKTNSEKYSEEDIIDVSEVFSVTETEFERYIDPDSAKKPENVTEKTAGLWQYQQVPVDEPEPYEEYIVSSHEYEGVRVTGARVRGKKHKHEGTNCDDWFEYSSVGDWTVLTVADGAGSKKFSRIGARESCRAAVAALREKLSETEDTVKKNLSLPLDDSSFIEECGKYASILQDAVIKAGEAVTEAFEDRRSKDEYSRSVGRNLELKDFSGTFLICIMLPVTVGDHREYFAVSCQIGDGIICSVDRNSDSDKALRLLGVPDSGTYSGETDFLTSEIMMRKETLMGKTKIMRGKTSAIMLMTDGVADDYFPASPEILRLYMDLELNGIIKLPDFSDDNPLPESIPEPAVYPWVNDNNQLIAVQYASSVEDVAEISTEQMWKRSNLIKKASLAEFSTDLPEKQEDRLLRWLDNYTQRGSFDDRTLLICELTEK